MLRHWIVPGLLISVVALSAVAVSVPSACPGDDDDDPKSLFCPGDDEDPKT